MMNHPVRAFASFTCLFVDGWLWVSSFFWIAKRLTCVYYSCLIGHLNG